MTSKMCKMMVLLFGVVLLFPQSYATTNPLKYKLNSSVYINATSLNYRSLPSVKGQRKGSFSANEKVTIIKINDTVDTINEIKNYWYQVQNGNKVGWVFGAYLSETPKMYIGVYRYREGYDKKDHFIQMQYNEGGFILNYIGCDPEVEHGLVFFRVTAKDLNISQNGSISFTLPGRNFYGGPLTFDTDLNKLETRGGTKSSLKFSGSFKKDEIFLKCSAADSFDCWEGKFTFIKQ